MDFRIIVEAKNADAARRMAERMADFTPVFEAIIDYWAGHNVEKFARAKGGELTGVAQTSITSWLPVTSTYYKAKHGANVAASLKTKKLLKRTMKSGGFADWLMVRTGELMQALTNRGQFFEAMTATSVSFGMPQDDADAMKVRGNWARRPVIFVDNSDQRMIVKSIQRHILGLDVAT